MSAETDRLMDNARIHVVGATDTALQLEMFNVLQEFFQDSNIWTEKVDFQVTAADDPADTIYYVEPESEASINRLMGIVNSANLPVYGSMTTPGEIVLNTQPSQDDVYTAEIALTVNDPVARDGFAECPVWILNKYGLGIMHGLVARMMSQPAKPFTNVAMAAYHQKKFRGAVTLATNEAQHKNVNNAQAWCFPRFGR